jgi:hypothetical protein
LLAAWNELCQREAIRVQRVLAQERVTPIGVAPQTAEVTVSLTRAAISPPAR